MNIRKRMQTHRFIAAAFLFAATFFAASSWSAGDELREPIDISMPAEPGVTIRIRHSFGSIDIATGADNIVHIRGEKRVSGNDPVIVAEFLKAMDIRADRRGKEIVLETNYPVQDMKKSELKKLTHYTITYEIEVPKNITLDVRNEFGDIVIGPVTGTCLVTNGFGKVAARDIKGDIEINDKFGGIKVENIFGALTIGNEHGGIVVRNVDGDLIGRTSYSDFDASYIKGNANIRVVFGKVIMAEIGGDADAETSFSSLDCRSVGGKASLKNMHGPVTADTIGKGAEIITKFGKASARYIGGDLTVDNEHGSIEAVDIDGSIRANTSFGQIKVNRITGNVAATSQNGSITVTDVLSGDSPSPRAIVLKTSFSSISLSAPATLSATFNGATSFGDLSCDFPITVEAGGLMTSQSSTRRINGTIGAGRDSIVIENANGSIKLINGGTPAPVIRPKNAPQTKSSR